MVLSSTWLRQALPAAAMGTKSRQPQPSYRWWHRCHSSLGVRHCAQGTKSIQVDGGNVAMSRRTIGSLALHNSRPRFTNDKYTGGTRSPVFASAQQFNTRMCLSTKGQQPYATPIVDYTAAPTVNVLLSQVPHSPSKRAKKCVAAERRPVSPSLRRTDPRASIVNNSVITG